MLSGKIRWKTNFQARRLSTLKSKPINFDETISSKSTQIEIAEALRPYFMKQSPFLLKGVNADSDALQSWKSLEYLQKTVGEDTPCMVEVGGNYSNSDVARPEISFGEYIQYIKLFQNHMNESENPQPNDKDLVYLAQNDLFNPLKKDIQIPDLCSDPSLGVGLGNLYSSMIWFGPAGCISPLHFDPLDNLLMQIIGRKRLIIFPKSADNNEQDKAWHYAGCNEQQYNTSPVDILNPNMEKYPLFSEAPTATVCDLEPGDIVYIPKKWWHHVTSRDMSISVNAWWR